MEDDRNERFEPVCKFGPGGDFVSVWPPESYGLAQPSANSLTKLLARLSGMIGKLLGSEAFGVPAGPTGAYEVAEGIPSGKGDMDYAGKDFNVDEPGYAAAATVTASNRLFSGEAMLFADDWRTGGRAGRKPKHHIRTYRRTAKQRTAVSAGGQGTLFELDFKRARTA
jgi:hypothetical protein